MASIVLAVALFCQQDPPLSNGYVSSGQCEKTIMACLLKYDKSDESALKECLKTYLKQ